MFINKPPLWCLGRESRKANIILVVVIIMILIIVIVIVIVMMCIV